MNINESRTTSAWRPTPRDRGAGVLGQRRCDRAKGCVLLVENDAVIADLFVTILEDNGYAVERATTPHGALVALVMQTPNPFDLVLSIPFTDPLDAPYAWLDRLRGWTATPVVICARCPTLFYADYREHGYAAFLEEPFDVQHLIDLVAALCPVPRDGKRQNSAHTPSDRPNRRET